MGEATHGSVLLFGSYDAELHPRVAVLRDGLAGHGWQVEELNAPLGASTADKVAAARSPRAAAQLFGRQARSWRTLVSGARRQGDPDVVVVGYMGHADVHLARALFRHSTIVLDHLVGLADTVADRELGGGAKLRVLHAADRAAIAAAEVVVVDTAQQAQMLPDQARGKAVVVPVGAGPQWFAAADRAASGTTARTVDPGVARVEAPELTGALAPTPVEAAEPTMDPGVARVEAAERTGALAPARIRSKNEDGIEPHSWMKSPNGASNLDGIVGGAAGGATGASGAEGAGGGAEGGAGGKAEGAAQGGLAGRTPESQWPSGPARPLRVVFFGLFTPLQGTVTIAEALDLLRDDPVEFTLIGTGQDHAEARRILADHPRVTWLDWVDGDDLPDLVARHDVCLGIFGTGPKAQRVVPTKVYQGLAAGCAVVTGDTPAAAALGDAVLRVPCGQPAALADQIRQLTTDREALTMARRRARSAAPSYTPVAATTSLSERLADRVGVERGLPPLTFNAWLRWDILADELDRIDAHDVLEIGPGEGAAACRLAQGRAYTGVELSDRTRVISAQRLDAQGTPGRLLGSLDELAPDEQFDLVCAFEVIEHIDDDREALAQWRARVRPGGSLLLSTPAGPERMGAADLAVGHFRRYSAEGLAGMAREVGFDEVEVRHYGYPFGYALEAVRNRVAARRLAAGEAAQPGHETTEAEVVERTKGSASFLQPPTWSGAATQLATAPGRRLQRRWPDRGTGLVLVARVTG